MFSFEYIAPFWYQQEAQDPGQNVLYLTKYTAKYPDLPTY
jgi:hypothetical protein